MKNVWYTRTVKVVLGEYEYDESSLSNKLLKDVKNQWK